jgi:DNA-binding transcriptional ArsR family regulator
MASVASPLLPPARRGWGPIPHTLFKAVPRRLPPGAKTELVIIGNIVDDTLGAPGRPEWVRATLAYFAHLANVTEDAAGKALKRLESLHLVESRRAGRGKEYRAKVENFERAQERAARHLRKPPTIAPTLESCGQPATALPAYQQQDLGPVGTLIDRIQSINAAPPNGGGDEATCPSCGRRTGERTADVPDQSFQRVSTSKAGADARYPLQGGWSGGETPAPARRTQLESFCLATITPRLGTVPEKNALTRALTALGRAPLEWLTSRITQRLELFEGPKASWGALPLLAGDVALAHRRLAKLRGDTVPIDLARHWASAAEVRRLHADRMTPEWARTELLLMWPELKAGSGRRAGYSDEFAAFLKGEHAQS